mgnify:CR=1 FL=1
MRHKRQILFMLVLSVALLSVQTVLAQDEPITLTYWETFGSQDGGVQAQIIAEFEASHPNVQIVQEFVPFEEMSVKLPPALQSGTGPDIIYADVAPQFLGSYVQAGHILPLSDAAEQFGWDERVFDWAQRRATYDGELFAIGHEMEVLTLMYNQKIFDELGLEVPTTLEELETTMAAIRDQSDYVPMMLATGPGPWNGFHMMHALAYAMMDVSQVANTTPQGDGSYADPNWLQVFEKYQEWVNAGYFPAEANSIDWEGHWSLFCAGQVAMLAQGTWLFLPLSECEAENPELFDFSVAPFPSAEGRPYQSYVGIGSAWYLNAALEEDPARKQAALEFLDALISPENAVRWVQEAQLFPAVPFDASSVELTEQQQAALAIVEQAGAEGGGPVPVGFNNSPEELEVWRNVVQGLVAGSLTPEQAAEMLNEALVAAQEAWAAAE